LTGEVLAENGAYSLMLESMSYANTVSPSRRRARMLAPAPRRRRIRPRAANGTTSFEPV
jgi:hypothetical protein